MKSIRTLKISISGVRGVIGDSLTPLLLNRFAQSFGTYVNSGLIVIGRDTRTSGEMVKHAVFAGLMSAGCRIVDLDICPVPTVQLMVRKLNAQGGIALTASHNPQEWNALKFIGSDGCFLNSYEAEELLDIYHQGEYTRVGSNAINEVQRNATAVRTHIDEILKHLGKLPGSRKRLRVVVDCCNGAGSVIAPALLEELGCEVTAINATPNGLFPRPPEPLPQNLAQLCQAVRESRADVGFAQDVDADRLAIVSNQGEAIGEEYSLVLATKYILSKKRGPVVANLSTTMALDDIARQFHCPIIRTKIGEVNVTEGMKKAGAVIGGEGNGGVIYPAINFARDSQVGMALVLHYLAESGRSLSALMRSVPRYYMVKSSLPCSSHKAQAILRMVKQAYSKDQIDLTDGIKIIRKDGWIHIRSSNTEPIVRVTVEARREALSKELAAEVMDRIGAV